MGIDFSAIIEYPEFDDSTRQVISRLESSDLLDEFSDLQDVALEKNEYAHVFGREWHWETKTVENSHVTVHQQKARPELPSLDWSLSTSTGFTLTFGKHLASIYHPLRWEIFIADEQWQKQVLKALGKFNEWFSATGCVVSHDCTAVVTWLNEPCLQSAIDKSVKEWGAFEASTLADTVREKPAPPNSNLGEKFYDSNGFWRVK